MITAIDPVTLDLIENALLNARFEMDEVLRRAAMSPTIRVQHDEFPMICDARGRMIVGQFGSYIPGVIDRLGGELTEGDVVLLNDPYLCQGSISHTNDWLVIVPIFHAGAHVGFGSMFGHMMDVGGKVPGSQVADATSIWEEGLRIPPIKIIEDGRLNEAALAICLNNSRTPEMNRSDLRRRAPGGGDLRAVRCRYLRGRLRSAAGAHTDRDGSLDPRVRPGGEGVVHRLRRRRRPR
jgi:N-methylhydantoinase B